MKLPKKSIESLKDTFGAIAVILVLLYVVGVTAGAVYNLVRDVLW